MSDKIIGDYSIFGGVDDNGQLLLNTNENAVKNSINSWFGSKFSERLRYYNTGGVIIGQITKNTTKERLSDLKEYLKDASQKDFNDLFYFTNIKFTLSNRELIIDYTIYIPALAKEVNGITGLKV